MKKTIAILLSFIMVLCSIPFVANAADDDLQQVEINEENFPDEEFRNFVSETYDLDNDGIVTSKDSNGSWLYIEFKDIESLQGYDLLMDVLNLDSVYLHGTGITEFTATDTLRNLYTSSTPLQHLDLSKAENLECLSCWHSDFLSNLDLKNNRHLSTLSLSNIGVSNLDLSNNLELTSLELTNLPLTKLDLSNNTKLENLDCSYNHLFVLDLSKNSKLTKIDLDQGNKVEVTYNKKLNSLLFDMNSIIDDFSRIVVETYNCTYYSETGIVIIPTDSASIAQINYRYDVKYPVDTDLTMNVSVRFVLSAADYSEVDAALASVPADLSVYTEETVNALNEIINNPVERDLDITRQGEVYDYADSINIAIANLEYKPADYAKVNEAIANIPADLTVYTEETVNALNEAVNAVVNDKKITEQNIVDNYAKAINNAVANLEYKPADYAKVNEAIASIPTDLTVYTDETVTALNEAVNAVVNGKNITEQNIVDNYAKAINNAIANLEYKPADYAKVNEAIASIPTDLTVYTDETVTALNETVNAVVTGKNITEQDVVDNYAKAINDAIANLEYRPADYAKVNEVIATIPNDLTVYTEETVTALNETVSAVVNDKNITEQAIVDSYAQAINKAIGNLEYKPADYTKVNEAIANIPEDLSIYTEETVNALNEAVNAVAYDKNITEQDIVDDYAMQIENAIAGLVLQEIPENEEQTTEPTTTTTNKDASSKSPETGAPSLAMPLIASLFILVCLALVFCNKKYSKKTTE